MTGSPFVDNTINNIEAQLRKEHQNSLAKLIGTSEGFLVEVITAEHRFFMKIRVDSMLERVILELYPLLSIPAPYTFRWTGCCGCSLRTNSAYRPVWGFLLWSACGRS